MYYNHQDFFWSHCIPCYHFPSYKSGPYFLFLVCDFVFDKAKCKLFARAQLIKQFRSLCNSPVSSLSYSLCHLQTTCTNVMLSFRSLLKMLNNIESNIAPRKTSLGTNPLHDFLTYNLRYNNNHIFMSHANCISF